MLCHAPLKEVGIGLGEAVNELLSYEIAIPDILTPLPSAAAHASNPGVHWSRYAEVQRMSETIHSISP